MTWCNVKNSEAGCWGLWQWKVGYNGYNGYGLVCGGEWVWCVGVLRCCGVVGRCAGKLLGEIVRQNFVANFGMV